jgi:hypothetical protein
MFTTHLELYNRVGDSQTAAAAGDISAAIDGRELAPQATCLFRSMYLEKSADCYAFEPVLTAPSVGCDVSAISRVPSTLLFFARDLSAPAIFLFFLLPGMKPFQKPVLRSIGTQLTAACHLPGLERTAC